MKMRQRRRERTEGGLVNARYRKKYTGYVVWRHTEIIPLPWADHLSVWPKTEPVKITPYFGNLNPIC